MCTPVFIAAQLTTARMRKQPQHPLTDTWIKEMRYIYAVENYSVIKKNKIMPFAAAWIDLENIILSEVGQTERGIPYDIIYI